VSQYISGQNVETIDLQLSFLNTTHWFTSVDYQNTSSFETPFESVVSRNSTNHYYTASNYYNWLWDLDPSNLFDFWIDPTNFSENYRFSFPDYDTYNVTVHNLENITLDGVGTFEAWNLSINTPLPNFAYYEKDTGMCLSYFYHFVSDVWYNVTRLELASLPVDYNGPKLTSSSPSNESSLASGSLITVDFTSPYGLSIINYNWDEEANLTSSQYIETSIPVSDGLHNLTIVAYDNVGYHNSYFLVYRTDNTLAGIILKSPRNQSQTQGENQVELTIISSNGTLFYNWDNDLMNGSIPVIANSAAIWIPNPLIEESHTLIVYVKSIDNVWTQAKYVFSVDNSAPLLTLYNFENNSVMKGVFSITLNTSEDVNLTYSLNSGSNNSLLVKKNENKSLSFDRLNNGTYDLYLELKDEAGNIKSLHITFFIHTSDFNWNWEIISEEPYSLDLYDENNTYWFTSSVVSTSNQFFNFSIITDDSYPILPAEVTLGIEFQCEKPTDIFFLTLTYPLSEQLGNSTDTFPLYQWIVWENQEWVDLETIYDQVSHSYITTYLGYSQYFAIIDSGEITQLKSVEVGGGSIPAFDLPTILFSVCVVVFIKKVKNKCQ
jgi:hypothetical protein